MLVQFLGWLVWLMWHRWGDLLLRQQHSRGRPEFGPLSGQCERANTYEQAWCYTCLPGGHCWHEIVTVRDLFFFFFKQIFEIICSGHNPRKCCRNFYLLKVVEAAESTEVLIKRSDSGGSNSIFIGRHAHIVTLFSFLFYYSVYVFVGKRSIPHASNGCK